MKNYFKLYEEYTRPRQFLFDVENGAGFDMDMEREEKYAHEWEFRGEKVLIVEGSVDDENADLTIKLIDSTGKKTAIIEFSSYWEIGPGGMHRPSKDYATLKIEKGSVEKEYSVLDEYMKGLEDYSTLMQSVLTMYEHTYTRHGHYAGKDYGIS